MTLAQLRANIIEWIKTGIPLNVKSSNMRTLLTWLAIRLDIQEPGRLHILKKSGNNLDELEVGDRVTGVVEDTFILNAIYIGGNPDLLSSYENSVDTTAEWGSITGDINNQTDLIDLLLSLTGNNPSGSSLINPFYFNSSGTLTYFLGADGFILNGTLYNTPVFGSVTLAESDETNNRFDVLVINQNGTVGVVQGTAAENPVIPLIHTNTQIAVTTILVEANTTEPADVVTDNVYNENAQIIGGEWNTSASGATVILDSEEQAQTGTKSIKFNNAAAGAWVLFENNQDSSGANLSGIKLSIYITETHNYRFSLKIPATDGNSAPGIFFENGQYGFSNTTLNTWQTIIIPATAFNGIAGIEFNSIQFSNERADSTFYVDQVQIQEGLNAVNNTLPNYTLELEANRLKLLKDGLVNSFVDLPENSSTGKQKQVIQIQNEWRDTAYPNWTTFNAGTLYFFPTGNAVNDNGSGTPLVSQSQSGIMIPKGYKVTKITWNHLTTFSGDFEMLVLLGKPSDTSSGGYVVYSNGDFQILNGASYAGSMNLFELYRDFYYSNSVNAFTRLNNTQYKRELIMDNTAGINEAVDNDAQLMIFLRRDVSDLAFRVRFVASIEIEEI